MNCNNCQELFSLYFDKEIDAKNKSLLEDHFSSCKDCRMEWNAFKNTVEFIHSIPMAEVPPDFLTGIRTKLDRQTPLQRLTHWLRGTGEKKVAISTAFAMLVIGFASASLLQVIPFSGTEKITERTPVQTGQVAQNNQEDQTIILADNKGQNNANQARYYPGIPLLSDYEENNPTDFTQLAMVPRKTREQQIPVVDFVSTHNMREPSYLSTPLSPYHSVNQPPAIKPDLYITMHAETNNEHVETIKQIMHSPLWRAEIYNENTLLLSVPAGNFNQLHQICCTKNTSFYPDYVRNNLYISPKRLLTVAVRLH